MIQWLLTIDSFEFPIAIIGSRFQNQELQVVHLEEENVATISTPTIESEYDYYIRTKGIDWVRSFYRPGYEDGGEDTRTLERDYMADDYEQGLYEHRDQYDWDVGGGYTDETLPSMQTWYPVG